MYKQVGSILFHYSQPKEDMYYDQVLADGDKKKGASQQQPKHR